ncbi:alpha-N-acetylgalactosaminide alpha-2,6-sialyltransferase 6 isoform X3 [Zootoca vivipara]|uniref:alpha-N-acetylgalactosaminide alpha-2,6-sialyltransferase 6 isoform X3 n=1 Tax=Zootoca vivipara TaxID=8524 RepID=UPI00293BB5BD|nr:alpha-N-acetylgalactosaminide alpha-2,6-sialyltransferase 6 isoform X3 [Zootoca vivipara]
MKNDKGQRAVVFVVLFGLVMLLIIYNGRSEVFHYTAVKVKPPLPSSLKKWGVKNGYLPVSGNKTLDHHCSQCVIVTSSSHLLGSKLGAAIDQSECTIRMNDAPTTAYEVDVGNKTTFRVVAHSSIFRVLKRPQEFVNKTPDTVLIFWGPPVRMQKSLLKVIQRVSGSFPNMTAFVASPSRMKQFDDLFKKETGKDRFLLLRRLLSVYVLLSFLNYRYFSFTNIIPILPIWSLPCLISERDTGPVWMPGTPLDRQREGQAPPTKKQTKTKPA